MCSCRSLTKTSGTWPVRVCMSRCVSVCVSIYFYVCAYVCMRARVCVSTSLCRHVLACVCARVCVSTSPCIHVFASSNARTAKKTRMRMRINSMLRIFGVLNTMLSSILQTEGRGDNRYRCRDSRIIVSNKNAHE